MAEQKAVFGIYRSRGAADNGVETLKNNGFRMSDISVLLPQESGSQDVIHLKESKAPEGAATGAGAGAVLGGALGLLAGIGALAIPGMGPFIAAGPILASLAGIGVGGAVGGVSGALIGFGIPEYEAKRYEGFVKEGGILISVHVDDEEWADKAQSILQATGAKDVAVTSELRSESEAFSMNKPYSVDPINSTRIL
jgi:hypothetical protein